MRTTLRRLAVGLLTLSALLTLRVSAANVLLIIADDLGTDGCPGYSGTDKPSMPNLQSLANSGTRFANVWAQPYCSPTRSCVLTGRFGYRTNVLYPGDRLDPNTPSLPDQLGSTSTALFGKWHLGGSTSYTDQQKSAHVISLGFDYYSGNPNGALGNFTSWTKYTTNSANSANVTATSTTTYATTQTVNDALAWINGRTGPWFAVVAFHDVHTPLHKPPITLLNTQASKDLPASSNISISAPQARAYYKAMCEAMDNRIGYLIANLPDQNLADTTIIFMGDNGTPSQLETSPLTGAKGSLSEGGVRVPFIVKGDAASGSGVTVNNLVNATDLYRTIAEIISGTNVATTGGENSRTILPYLKQQTHPNPRTTIYADVHVPGGNPARAIRNTRYKLLRVGTSGNFTESFFDLGTTGNGPETTNLLNGTLTSVQQSNLTSLRDTLNSAAFNPFP